MAAASGATRAIAVLTRDAEAAAPYAAALAPLGLDAVAMPVTREAPPPDPGALGRALARGGHVAIVCASARAAAALLAAAADPAALPPVWAVGPATAAALAAGGVRAAAPAGAHDAASLAAALRAAVPLAGARVLVPRAEGGRDEAIAALAAAGAAVDAVIAYRTVAVAPDDVAVAAGRGAIARGEAAVCAVFAPSQVAALRAIVGPGALRAQRYAAIGGTTAAALRASGVPAGAIRAAITPTPEGIATAVAAVYPPRS